MRRRKEWQEFEVGKEEGKQEKQEKEEDEEKEKENIV